MDYYTFSTLNKALADSTLEMLTKVAGSSQPGHKEDDSLTTKRQSIITLLKVCKWYSHFCPCNLTLTKHHLKNKLITGTSNTNCEVTVK